MQRTIIKTFTRISISNIFNISARYNSTLKSLINKISELPVYNYNKLSFRDIDLWEKTASEILDITITKRNEDNKHEKLNDYINFKHTDYLNILEKLCDRGYNDKKFYTQFISNLHYKFDKISSPKLLTHLLLVLYRCKIKFKPILYNCTKTLDREMETTIGQVFLDKIYIQQLIKNLLRYITATGHMDSITSSIFELVLYGYNNVQIPTLVDILYNLSICYNLNKDFEIICYQEHDHNTPKQHFLVPISRFIHKHELRPIEKAKLFRCYILFDYDHITFTNNILSEISEILKKSIEFDDYDHHDSEYIQGFTKDSDNYTLGQILMITDSLLMSRRHHYTRNFKELVQSVYFNCLNLKHIDKLDPKQLRCAMTIIGNSTKHINPDQKIIQEITKQMIDYLECNRVDIKEFTLFLKDLVRLTRIKFVRKNERNRTIRITKFSKLNWITESKENEKSFLERISKQLSIDVDIVDLTHCLRSLAYLGYNNHDYYRNFLSHIKSNVDKLPSKCIAYVEQTLNKVKLTDGHTFYLLGKRFQELQLECKDKEPKILLRRIG